MFLERDFEYRFGVRWGKEKGNRNNMVVQIILTFEAGSATHHTRNLQGSQKTNNKLTAEENAHNWR
jgi:hypothetical protein